MKIPFKNCACKWQNSNDGQFIVSLLSICFKNSFIIYGFDAIPLPSNGFCEKAYLVLTEFSQAKELYNHKWLANIMSSLRAVEVYVCV